MGDFCGDSKWPADRCHVGAEFAAAPGSCLTRWAQKQVSHAQVGENWIPLFPVLVLFWCVGGRVLPIQWTGERDRGRKRGPERDERINIEWRLSPHEVSCSCLWQTAKLHQRQLWNETFHLVYISLVITHENHHHRCLSCDSWCYRHAAASHTPPTPSERWKTSLHLYYFHGAVH